MQTPIFYNSKLWNLHICLEAIQIKVGSYFFVLDYVSNDLYTKHVRMWLEKYMYIKISLSESTIYFTLKHHLFLLSFEN